jgi:hypothetical protein
LKREFKHLKPVFLRYEIRATSHMRLRTVTITLQALSLVEKAEPVQVRFTLHLRDQQSKLTQDGYKVYMDSYLASNGSCFMITWIVFKNYLLEVVRTQNQETKTLRTLTTVDLFYCIMCEDPHE